MKFTFYNDPGRARRPLIIVKEGEPLLKEEHINKVANGKLGWDDLIDQVVSSNIWMLKKREKRSYIAMSSADLNEDHTHPEIDPATMPVSVQILFHSQISNSSPRNTMEAV